MKVYLGYTEESMALLRIKQALQEYKPAHVEEVLIPEAADMVMLYVTGNHDSNAKKIELYKSQGKRVALIQCSLRSTRNPNTADWIPLWEAVDLVWSYYDLPMWIQEDGNAPSSFNFYHSPLGCGKEFRPHRRNKDYTICTTGGTFEAESLHEIWTAAGVAGVEVEHVGKIFDWYPAVTYIPPGGNRDRLAGWFSQALYVSGLRRIEGFELPAAGGAACGARPVLYDRPHYRKWFDGLAVFIPEASPAEVTKSLIELFQSPRAPMSGTEMREAYARFDWTPIIKGFWERL
jgi:hypothetical protein